MRSGNLDGRIARLAVIGGVPGALLGALASSVVSGEYLLVLSGLLLLVVGARVLLPDRVSNAEAATARRDSDPLVLGSRSASGS